MEYISEIMIFQHHLIVISMWWKCDEDVMAQFLKISTGRLFHHIFITMVWTWVLKNIAECMIPSNCHKNVMEMWCQEKKICKLKFQFSKIIHFLLFQNHLIVIKLWWKCDERYFVPVFWHTSLENAKIKTKAKL